MVSIPFREQLDFLKEIQAGSGTRAEILYMSAVHGRHTSQPPESVLASLNEAVDSHFRAVRGLTFGPDYLTTINPVLCATPQPGHFTTLYRTLLCCWCENICCTPRALPPPRDR